jgi:hypothetical protein
VKFNRYPIISSGAEHLVMGYLMRRNILTFKAPPNHEGYDLICIHPGAKENGAHLRIQVKSRLATDSPLAFPVRKESLDAFDYLVLVLLNVGNFYGRAKQNPAPRGACTPTIFTFPQSFVKRHFDGSSSWKKVCLHQLRLDRYRDDRGIERIARRLKIEYPTPASCVVGYRDFELQHTAPSAKPVRIRKPR